MRGALIALAFLCALPATAAGAIRISGPTHAVRVTGMSASGNLVSDRDRYIAFNRRASAPVTVFDTRLRKLRSARTTCQVIKAVPGVFLTGCSRLLNPRTRRTRSIPGSRPSDNLYELGTHWVAGEVRDTACGAPRSPIDCTTYVAINWRTGERHECDDLDEAHPCPEYGWNLNSQRLRGWRDDQSFVVGRAGPYVLEEIDGGNGLRLSAGSKSVDVTHARCCNVGLNPVLSTEYVTWTERPRHRPVGVFAFGNRSHRRLTWAVRGAPQPVGLYGDRIRAWHTRFGVLIRVLTEFDQTYREAHPREYRLYLARWPRG